MESEPLGSWLRGSQSLDTSRVGDSVVPQYHHPLLGAICLGLPPSVQGCPGLPGALITVLPVWGSAQPRTARSGTCGRTGTSVSGATTAVRLRVPSRASTLSRWPAPCSVWRAATHTALRVRPWPPRGRGGGLGWSSEKLTPCPASPRPRLAAPCPRPHYPRSCFHVLPPKPGQLWFLSS